MNLNKMLSLLTNDRIFQCFIIQVLLAWLLGVSIVIYVYWRKIAVFLKRTKEGIPTQKKGEYDHRMADEHPDGQV